MPVNKEKNGTWTSRFYVTDYKGERKQKKRRGFATKCTDPKKLDKLI